MGVLSNLKVLDFSTLLPGPFATLMLADLGAEVIHVESAARPDLIRTLGPRVHGVSVVHSMLNRNKKSLTLDLKKPEAIEIVGFLVQDYDIVVEQFRPGVMERLGLGYQQLCEINPSVIYCSISGYGQTGPYRERAGHDNNYLSIAGVNGYSGRQGERTPIMGIQIADIAGGSLHSVIGILAAVNHRAVTGEGQHVDVSMTDTAFSLNALFGCNYLAANEEPRSGEMQLNGGSFYDYYETADERYMSVGGIEPHFFRALCITLGGEELLALGMRQDRDSIQQFRAELERRFKQKTQAQWCEFFADKDACVEPVLSFAEATENEQLVARGMITEVPTPASGSQRQIASPIKFSASRARYHFSGVQLGAHSGEVLAGLGMSETDIERLAASGVLG